MALGWEDKGGRGKDGCALLGRGIRIHFCSHLSVFNQKLHVELLSRIFWGHQKFYWSHFSKVRTILHVLYFHSLFNQPIIHFTCQLDLGGKAQRQHCHFSSRTPRVRISTLPRIWKFSSFKEPTCCKVILVAQSCK